jgi:hypothetical protein
MSEFQPNKQNIPHYQASPQLLSNVTGLDIEKLQASKLVPMEYQLPVGAPRLIQPQLQTEIPTRYGKKVPAERLIAIINAAGVPVKVHAVVLDGKVRPDMLILTKYDFIPGAEEAKDVYGNPRRSSSQAVYLSSRQYDSTWFFDSQSGRATSATLGLTESSDDSPSKFYVQYTEKGWVIGDGDMSSGSEKGTSIIFGEPFNDMETAKQPAVGSYS